MQWFDVLDNVASAHHHSTKAAQLLFVVLLVDLSLNPLGVCYVTRSDL